MRLGGPVFIEQSSPEAWTAGLKSLGYKEREVGVRVRFRRETTVLGL